MKATRTMWAVEVRRTARTVVNIIAETPEQARAQAAELVCESDFFTHQTTAAYVHEGVFADRWWTGTEWQYPEEGLL